MTYTLNNRTWLAEARQTGGTVTDVSTQLDGLASGVDRWINISPDGEWLLLESERFDDECNGWACLIYGKRDFSEFRVVKLAVPNAEGSVIHPEGFSAIANGGDLIVAHISDNGRNDLMVTRKTGNTWSTPQSITVNSPSTMNLYPAISADGQEVLFHCGDNICIVNTDGSGLQTLIRPADGPSGSWEEVRSADFDASSGDIILKLMMVQSASGVITAAMGLLA